MTDLYRILWEYLARKPPFLSLRTLYLTSRNLSLIPTPRYSVFLIILYPSAFSQVLYFPFSLHIPTPPVYELTKIPNYVRERNWSYPLPLPL